jgi:site-specific DNA recombinase
MIAAIYARKSTEQHIADEEKSVTRQLAHARAYAERKGWRVADAHVYTDDGISGAEFGKRPGFVRLMNALTPRAPFDVLIMSEASRLGREQIETAYALKQIITAGVRVFCYLEDRECTLDSAIDKMLAAITHCADELERERATVRTTDAMFDKAAKGHVTGGRVFGYDNVDIIGAPGQRRAHVERRINGAEADIVRRIFTHYEAGAGLRTIAHALNAAGAPAPMPRRRERIRGWAASSVRAMLYNELYRGVILYGRTKKRDQWGRKRQHRRDPAELVRVEAPALRIVPEALWVRVHERLDGVRTQYARVMHGKLWGRPPSGVDSKFLLTGFAVCGVCGGSLCVRSRSHGRSRVYFYGCVTHERKGASICPNAHWVPMVAMDHALLEALEVELLDAAVIARTIEKAMGELQQDDTGASARGEALRRELATVERQLGRLTQAIVLGGELSPLVAQLKRLEGERAALTADLAAVERLSKRAVVDGPELRAMVEDALADYRGLLTRQTTEGRAILRELLVDRVVYTPTARANGRWGTFTAECSLGRKLYGVLVDPNGGGPKRKGQRRSRWSRAVIMGERFSPNRRSKIKAVSIGQSYGEGHRSWVSTEGGGAALCRSERGMRAAPQLYRRHLAASSKLSHGRPNGVLDRDRPKATGAASTPPRSSRSCAPVSCPRMEFRLSHRSARRPPPDLRQSTTLDDCSEERRKVQTPRTRIIEAPSGEG